MFNSMLLATSATSEINLDDDLIAHYLLNNNASDVLDLNNGTANGGVDFQGDSASFDNTTHQYISSALSLGPVSTISFWLKRNSGGGTDYVFLTDTGTSFFQSNNTVHWCNDVFYPADSTEMCPNEGQLYHIVFVDTGSEIKAYRDEIEVGNTASYKSLNSFVLRYIGSYTTNSYSFYGNLSNLRIYNTAKSQDFKTALFNEGYHPRGNLKQASETNNTPLKGLTPPTTDGLVAHYPLTGTSEDSTGNYDGVENGNTYIDDPEKGSVASFDGVNDYISINSTLPTGAITFSAWIKTTDTRASRTRLFDSAYSNYAGALSIYHNNGKLMARRGNNVNQEFDIISEVGYGVNGGEFHHILVTSNGSNEHKLYIDNILQATNTTAISGIADDNETTIGARNFEGTYDFNFEGQISDTRIYNKVLSEQEIEDIYTYEKNLRNIPIDDGLRGFYKLDSNAEDNNYPQIDGVVNGGTFNGDSYESTIASHYISGMEDQSGEFTFSLWISKKANIALDVFGNSSSGSELCELRINRNDENGRILLTLNGGGDLSFYSSIVEIDRFYMLTITRDSNNDIKVFVDGEEEGAYNSVGILDLNTYFGRGRDYGGEHLSKKLRIYNKALSEEQIKVIYNTEK